MAKKSMVQREEKRESLIQKYQSKRLSLKKEVQIKIILQMEKHIVTWISCNGQIFKYINQFVNNPIMEKTELISNKPKGPVYFSGIPEKNRRIIIILAENTKAHPA